VDRVGHILGEEVQTKFEENSELDTRSIVVENTSVVNRTLQDLDVRLRYNVSITRILRAGVEFVPREDLDLQYGDVVIAVGTSYQLDQLELFLGHEHHTVQRRVDIGSLAATLFLAFAIGGIIVPVPALGSISLGLAGGALVAGLIFGHFGRIGNFIGRFPGTRRPCYANSDLRCSSPRSVSTPARVSSNPWTTRRSSMRSTRRCLPLSPCS